MMKMRMKTVNLRGSPFFGPKTGLFKVDRSLFES